MKIFVAKRKTLYLSVAAITALILAIWAVFSTGSYAVVFGTTLRKLPIYSVERDKKQIAITFDAAWGVDYTDAILSELSEYDVPATFFLVEFWAKKYPDYVKKIDAAGHSIGTHSATHSYMSKLSAETIKTELSTSSAAITEITGKKVTLFRPPYGDYNDRLISTAEEQGYYCIQWDVDSLDWKDLSAGEIAKRVTSRVKNGSIILCHNNGLHTAVALPLIFEALQNGGYEFVTVDALIYHENYQIDSCGRQHAAK
jgi:polysaccharide deacetylase family sporulation protein PdaB